MRLASIASVLVVAAALVSCKGSEPKPVTITISPETADLAVGATQQFSATVGGTDNTDVLWSTSAASIATVSTSGLVTAVAPGTAEITATASENIEVQKSATLTVTSNATALTSGVAVTGISGASGSQRHYRVTVPTGATQLSVTTNGSGDLDLFVKRGTQATTTTADCDSEGTTAAESCVIANPQAGEWYVMLYGYTAYSNVSLTATVTGGGTTPTSGFTIANSTSTPSVVRGSSTSLTVTATRAGTFTGAIDLTVTGLPSGVTASFAPATLSSSQSTSTLTLTASASATTGAATITVRGNSTGQAERTATATLTVSASGSSSSITLLPSTDVIYVARGQYTWGTVGVTSTTVTGSGQMTAENVGAGLTVEWKSTEDNAATATAGYNTNDYHARFRISASASAPLGNATITIRATSNAAGNPSSTTTFGVVVVDAQAATNPGWTQLALGAGVSCGRRGDDKTYCWGGLNSVGDGTLGSVARVPAIAAMGREFTSVGYGSVHGCGVESNVAYCWGANNGFGLLGNGQSDGLQRMPVPVSGSQSFTSVAVGHSFTCALTPAGAAYCWGSQLSGWLGDGVIGSSNGDFKTTPTAVLGGVVFATLSAGKGHTCGLTAAGAAWCWGANATGQLGDGTQTTRAQPVQVTGGLSFTKISAGDSHTCALTSAGKAYCWGSVNRVGDAVPATQNKTSPYALPTAMSFTEISAGWTHSCAISTTGAAYCWGDNYYGGIGNGTSGSTTAQRGVTAVSGGLTFSRIMARDYTSCGVTTANALYCWGYNNYGKLGDGTTTNRTVPTLAIAF